MYARIHNGAVVEFPIMNIRQRLPQYSFPEIITDGTLPAGFVTVSSATSFPSPGPTQKVEVAGTPVLVNGKWQLPFVLVEMSLAEIDQRNLSLLDSVRDRVQDRLDAFARTRNFDGILSACTYATSSVPNFQEDGQRAVDLRDATWAKTYEILAEVQAGERAIPASYEAIEPELPTLSWTTPSV